MTSILLLLALTAQEDGPRKNNDELPVFTGDLLRIEDNKLILGIRKDGLKAGEESFTFNDAAIVLIEGERARLQDLRIGRPVRIAHRDRVAVRIEVPRRESERPRDGRREGDRPAEVRREGERPAGDRREAERPPDGRREVERREGDRPPEARREGDRPVERREGERPPVERREGERRDGDRPVERREGERREERERVDDEAVARRRAEERAREEAPFPVDPAIVPPTEKQPDHGGRVLSVFDDDIITLITIRRGATEVPLFLPKGTPATYVGIEKDQQKPTAGYVAYIWLKEGSRDTAARVTFGLEKRK